MGEGGQKSQKRGDVICVPLWCPLRQLYWTANKESLQRKKNCPYYEKDYSFEIFSFFPNFFSKILKCYLLGLATIIASHISNVKGSNDTITKDIYFFLKRYYMVICMYIMNFNFQAFVVRNAGHSAGFDEFGGLRIW